MKKQARRLAGGLLGRVQAFSPYRELVRRVGPAIEIKEASEEERRLVHAWLNPGALGKQSYSDSNVTDFVAKRGSEVVGFVQMLRGIGRRGSSERYGLFSLVVKPFYRGMGIGRKLTLRVVDEARKEGARELVLFVFEDNRRAITLYKNLGFTRVVLEEFEEELEKEKDTFGRRRIVMSLKLR